jgi:hypothetical protein
MSEYAFKRGPVRLFVVTCFAVIFCSLMFAPSLLSQTAATGALTGTLRDSSGAVVPNATVTVTSIGTAQVRTTTTSGDGTYKVGLLPPGNYSLKFEAAGFNSLEVPSVTVVVTETAVLDQTLQVGAQTQQVEVRAETEAVQTASSTVGNVVSSQTMTAMPLTSRNYTNLLGLAAGANASVFNAANLGRGSQDIAVNGATVAQNNYSMDGASIVNFTTNGNTADGGANPGIGIVNPDAIEEFKIQTSMFDAGYGRKPGANVNVVTKSGTNQFHGTAFEFFRNTELNANDFFRKISPAVGGVAQNGRQVLNQNQFGGVFGGPVKKDKLFFFVSYQETQQKNGISPAGYSTPTLVGIPTGDRTTAAFQTALGAAFCGGKTSNGGTQVACNGSNISPVALNLLRVKNPDGTYFIPGSSTGANQNVTFSLPATYKEHQAIGNVDYVLNSANTLSGRWSYSGDRTNATMDCSATGSTISQCLPGNPAQIWFMTQYAVLKLTSSLSPNLVNEARISMQRNVVGPQNGVPLTDTQVGITPLVPSVNTLDSVTVSGLFAFGGRGNLATLMWDTSVEGSDQISWSHGKHTVRAGFEFERDQENWQYKGVAIGALTFQTFQDFLLGLPGCTPGSGTTATLTTAATGACLASQVAGTTNGTSTSNISSSGSIVSATPPGGVNHAYRIAAADAFVQDDYKVLSNLTLNLGLRWEYDGLVSDSHGLLTNVWPNLITTVNTPASLGGTLGTTPATGTLAGFVVPSNFNFAAFPTPPVGGLFQNNQKIATQNSPSIKNYSPRVGLAWKPLPTDKFVVRAGGGFFYDRVGVTTYNKSTQTSIPYAVPYQQSGAANYFSSFSQPYAPAALGWTPRWASATTTSNLNVVLTAPVYPTPLTYEWNLNAQYEFAPRWVVELGYVGTRSIHQAPDNTVNAVLEHQINESLLASAAAPVNGINTNTTSNASLRVPYLGFAPAGLGDDQAISDSKYNSLQATVRKQLSNGLTLTAAYAYSRGVTTTSFINFNDPDLPLQYGLTPFIHPQRFTVNYSYDLPFGKHDGWMDKLTSGWNLSGVTVVQDGTALTVTDTRGGAIYGYSGAASVISTAEFAAGMGNANVPTPGNVLQRLGGTVLGGPGYFNKGAFGTIPNVGVTTAGTGGTGYGNAGYGIILGPGQFNFDATIQKVTKVGGIHEDATLVFRTEFFNAFNHPQFSNPSVTDDSKSTFGQITSASVNPRLIQFALKYVF